MKASTYFRPEELLGFASVGISAIPSDQREIFIRFQKLFFILGLINKLIQLINNKCNKHNHGKTAFPFSTAITCFHAYVSRLFLPTFSGRHPTSVKWNQRLLAWHNLDLSQDIFANQHYALRHEGTRQIPSVLVIQHNKSFPMTTCIAGRNFTPMINTCRKCYFPLLWKFKLNHTSAPISSTWQIIRSLWNPFTEFHGDLKWQEIRSNTEEQPPGGSRLSAVQHT